MRWIHIACGLIGIASGAVALVALKGRALHRRSGLVFVYSMLAMSSAAILLALAHQPGRGNIVAGVLTFYMVATAFTTVHRPKHLGRQIDTITMMMVVLTLGIASIGFGLFGHEDPQIPGGYPPVLYFILGAFAVRAAVEDIRMIAAGGLQGAERLKRHLGRMGAAMSVATASFFLGQPQVFAGGPLEPIGVRAIPLLLVLIATIYWRVRMSRRPLTLAQT